MNCEKGLREVCSHDCSKCNKYNLVHCKNKTTHIHVQIITVVIRILVVVFHFVDLFVISSDVYIYFDQHRVSTLEFCLRFPLVFDVYPITWGCVSACVCIRVGPNPKYSGRNLCFSLPPHVKILPLDVFWSIACMRLCSLQQYFQNIGSHGLVCEACTVYVDVQTCAYKHMMKVTNQSTQNHTTQLNSFWQATHKSRGQTMLLQGHSSDETDCQIKN